jgi:hypothetical protein
VTLQPGLEFDNVKPQLESGIFKCTSWLNGSFFEGDDRGFLKDGVMTYLMAPISPINSPTYFRSSNLYYMAFTSNLTKTSLYEKKTRSLENQLQKNTQTIHEDPHFFRTTLDGDYVTDEGRNKESTHWQQFYSSEF